MKIRIMFFYIILLPSILYSQTFSEIKTITSFYGKPLDEFEKGLSTKHMEKETKFGIETRSYIFNSYDMLISEKDDNELIGSIRLFGKNGADDEETWYNIIQYAAKDKELSFVKSFLSSEEDDVYMRDVSLEQMLKKLRGVNNTDDYIYYIVYKYKNLYLKFNNVRKKLYITIDSEYEK